MVGADDGDADGTVVGFDVGFAVGDVLGTDDVGNRVGCACGFDDSEEDDCTDGTTVDCEKNDVGADDG